MPSLAAPDIRNMATQAHRLHVPYPISHIRVAGKLGGKAE
jgi:hypothetical protein